MEVDTLFHSDDRPGHKPTSTQTWEDDALNLIHMNRHYKAESGLTIRLAGAFGFCQGVKHAVEKALATVDEHAEHRRKPGNQRSRLLMTGEIIHNPSINEQLAAAGVEILPPSNQSKEQTELERGTNQTGQIVADRDGLSMIRPEDWVIIPAFGIPLKEEASLRASGCRVIDTTCGWVRRIWHTVEEFTAAGLVTVIHGKVEHEETRATASRAGKGYVVVRDQQEANLLGRAIRREAITPDQLSPSIAERMPAAEDLAWPNWFNIVFAGKCSAGLNPVSDLDRIGLVNQTTMLSTETDKIARILRDSMTGRLGRPADERFFRTLDTFCPATQRRQDAVREMLLGDKPDAMIVVGGFSSSNTAHLAQLASEQIPAYQVEGADCLIDGDRIRHRIPGDTELSESRDWRPKPPCTIAVTAGASTPDTATDQTILRLISLYSTLLLFIFYLLGSTSVAADSLGPEETKPACFSGGQHETHLSCFTELQEKAELNGWRNRVSPELTVPDSTGYDAQHVDLLVKPTIETESVWGQALWTVVVTEEGKTDISFDFFDNMEILHAELNGLPASFTRRNNRIYLQLQTPVSVGDEVTALIRYQGTPELGYIWGFDVRYHNDVPIIYTSCEPIASRTWWPCKDRPEDKFTADLSFVVPDSMIAVSNGLLIETISEPGGLTRYHWRESYPTASYLVSMTATNYAYFEDTYTSQTGQEMPLTFYAYPEDLTRAQEDWSITAEAIGFMANLFGEYPFIDEKYGMAEYAWGGAMEHQTISSMGDYFFQYDLRSEWVVIHELAHQWWGDWVTCGTWRDIWLNEGFATYTEALWAEYRGGADSLQAVMVGKKSDLFYGPLYDPNFVLNGTVYRKGAWVLHMLRHIIGDEDFFGALQEYGQAHAYQNAVTDDLQAVMERAWGGSLDWFFEQWVYQTGRPTYSAFWAPVITSITGPQAIKVTIFQESTGPDFFKMPIDARFYLPDGEIFTAVLWDSLPEQDFIVHLPDAPDSLALDPRDWILADIDFVADVQSSPDFDPRADRPGPIVILGQPYPNPTAASAIIPISLEYPHRLAHRADEDEGAHQFSIFDPSGRRIRRLRRSDQTNGTYQLYWDGQTENGERAPGGIYFVKPDQGTEPGSGQTRRITVIH